MNIVGASAAAALVAGLAFGSASQAATLVGEEVTCTFGLGSCSPSVFTITEGDPNPDTVVRLGGVIDALAIDFMGGWVDITALDNIFFGASTTVTLSGLRPANDAETYLYDLSITGVSGLTADDFMLSGGVLTIDLQGSTWGTGSSVGFDVAVPLPPAAVPLPPAAVLLLAGLAGLGIAGRKRA